MSAMKSDDVMNLQITRLAVKSISLALATSFLLAGIGINLRVTHTFAADLGPRIGGFVVWPSVDGPCETGPSEVPSEDCQVLGTSFIADFFDANIERFTGSEYRVVSTLVDEDTGFIFESGIRAAESKLLGPGERWTAMFRHCRVGDDAEEKRWTNIAPISSGRSLGITGHVHHESACAIQNHSQTCKPKLVWQCKAHSWPGQSMIPQPAGQEIKMPGVQLDFNALTSFHGFELIDRDTLDIETALYYQSTTGLAKYIGVTGFHIGMRDHVYYFRSSSHPLQNCPTCRGTGSWRSEVANTAEWPSASPMDNSAAQFTQFSASEPAWEVCYKYASGTQCFCDQITDEEQATVEVYPSATQVALPVPHWVDVTGGRTSPVDYSLREQYTQAYQNIYGPTIVPDPWTEPVTVRYNCHGLTFRNGSFENPIWLNFAELDLPGCGSEWFEILESEPPGPEDVAVWFDNGAFNSPG